MLPMEMRSSAETKERKKEREEGNKQTMPSDLCMVTGRQTDRAERLAEESSCYATDSIEPNISTLLNKLLCTDNV
jgi:transglutaminase-like putative cysteine protease